MSPVHERLHIDGDVADLGSEAEVPGVSEEQEVDLAGATAGTFTLDFDGQVTAGIAWDATAAAVETALEALSNVEVGDVLCTGGPLNTTPVSVFFQAGLGSEDQTLMVIDGTGLTGGTPVVTEVTKGVSRMVPHATGDQARDVNMGDADVRGPSHADFWEAVALGESIIDAPTDVSAVGGGASGEVDVTFTLPAGADDAEIVVFDYANDDVGGLVSKEDAASSPATITGLTASGKFAFFVRGATTEGEIGRFAAGVAATATA